MGSGCGGSLPAGRHPSRATTERPISRSAARSRRSARNSHPRVLAARSLAGRRHARAIGAGVPHGAESAGLGSMPGTAAEILDDEVRAVICPDKVTTAQWLDVIETAHHLGIRTTATIMFGHVDHPRHWARHLLRHPRACRPAPEASPSSCRCRSFRWKRQSICTGLSRLGPTFREAVLMHAVARLALHPYLTNIQTSWVKMGRKRRCRVPAGGRQRPRRHADEREHQPRCRLRAWRGNVS